MIIISKTNHSMPWMQTAPSKRSRKNSTISPYSPPAQKQAKLPLLGNELQKHYFSAIFADHISKNIYSARHSAHFEIKKNDCLHFASARQNNGSHRMFSYKHHGSDWGRLFPSWIRWFQAVLSIWCCGWTWLAITVRSELRHNAVCQPRKTNRKHRLQHAFGSNFQIDESIRM